MKPLVKPVIKPVISSPSIYSGATRPTKNGVYWIGQDGKVYVKGAQGTNAAGRADGNTASYWGGRGYQQISDPATGGGSNPTKNPAVVGGGGGGGGGYGGGGGGAAKTLDEAQLSSLDSLLASFDTIRNQAKQKAALKRDEAANKKRQEKEREEGKYKGKKLSTLQDFSGAKTDTDLNTRNTLENLMSSLSTLGLGGSRALTRQILDAANMSNRKANATQAKDNQGLDSAWNEYSAGNESDMAKIQDQFGYDTGEADRDYFQNKQNTLYKKADVYNAADRAADRQRLMNEGNSLNSRIAGAAFMNPSYTGTDKTMATPELGDYTQDIANYDTTDIGAEAGVAGGMNVPGNLAIKAMAVNDKDLGIKKKTEADLGYGV